MYFFLVHPLVSPQFSLVKLAILNLVGQALGFFKIAMLPPPGPWPLEIVVGFGGVLFLVRGRSHPASPTRCQAESRLQQETARVARAMNRGLTSRVFAAACS